MFCTPHRLGRLLGRHDPQLRARVRVMRATVLSINQKRRDVDADGTTTRYYNQFGE